MASAPQFSIPICHQNLDVGGEFEDHSTELKSGVMITYPVYHPHLSSSLNLPLDLIRYPINVLVLFPYVSAKMALANVRDFEQHTLLTTFKCSINTIQFIQAIFLC